MSSVILANGKSARIECSYNFNWTIKDFICNDTVAGVYLPSVKFDFVLRKNMIFTGGLSIRGDSCQERKLSIEVKCTNYSTWKVVCHVVWFGTNRKIYFNEKCTIWELPLHKELSCVSLNMGSSLAIQCKISYISYESTVTPICPIKESKFQYEFSEYLKTKEFSDVVFKVSDKDIRAHKMLLALRSPVFKAMFENQMAESLSNEVIVDDIESNVFEEMLHFIYTDEAPNLKILASKLLAVSDKYDLPTLKTMCDKELTNNISFQNIAQILVLADLHRADNLKMRALNFMKNNKSHLSKVIFNLKNHHHLVDELLSEMIK